MATNDTNGQKEITGISIRDLRTRLGISQEELAYAVGFEQSLISKIELDRIKSPTSRLRLHDALIVWAIK